jgi:hypothetical protein
MSTLSRKIIQLMAYESQLKELKAEIVSQNIALLNEPEHYLLKDTLKRNMEEYELISAKYGDLFEEILLDSAKMKEEYQDIKKETDCRVSIFTSRQSFLCRMG